MHIFECSYTQCCVIYCKRYAYRKSYLLAYFNSRCPDRVRVVKNSNYSKTFEICNLHKLFWIKQLEREKRLALSDKHNFHNKFNRWRKYNWKSTIGNGFGIFYVFLFLLPGGVSFGQYTVPQMPNKLGAELQIVVDSKVSKKLNAANRATQGIRTILTTHAT